MSVAVAEPGVEAEVLTALDFDTPPVEVTGQVEVKNLNGKTILTLEGAKITYSVDPANYYAGYVPPEFSFSNVEPLTSEKVVEAYTTMKVPCPCSLCQRHVGPMAPQVKSLWTTALRSKEYKQGRGALRQVNLLSHEVWHCALGVLIDLAIKAGVHVTEEVNSDGISVYDGNGACLPPAVMAWAGLNGPDPTLGSLGSVSQLNDHGMPFSQIADLIDANL